MSPIDVVFFAPLAPIFGVLLFWFIQLLFIESQKYLLSKIRQSHKALCRFTNFLGILFQTICHALGYTVTKSGISDFYVSVHYGKVAPKKERKGVFEWISNAFLFIGPFFIPASLLLICLFFLVDGFEIVTPIEILEAKYTFAGQMISFGTNLHLFSKTFFTFLLNIDLLHPAHFGFVLLLIFLGMGIRPSYVGKEKREKVDMMYDLRNIWLHITHKPLYVIILFLLGYLLFYISFWLEQDWYVILFSVFGWLSIIAVISLVITDLVLLFIRAIDEITYFWKIIPYAVIPISYILTRSIFFFYLEDFFIVANRVSLIVMIFSTFFVTLFLLKYKTNRFKTERDMDSLRKEKDGSKERREGNVGQRKN
ncbi:MAG: hypothetical protein JSW62_05375 [Thermoplasmatales archaeon]|nr:MAG: hypothetical protein JSW62_05375 [Thermoplasmatales archaeon]